MGPALNAEAFSSIRRRMMLDHFKWDPQIGDESVLLEQPLLLSSQAWVELATAAEQMAAEIARVYRALPESERAGAVFFGPNYGEAAAIDIYGPEFGAPPAISAHNNYFLWSPRGYSGSVVITLGGGPSRKLAANFAAVETAGHIASPYAMGYENDRTVYVLRRPLKPLDEVWPKLKVYD